MRAFGLLDQWPVEHLAAAVLTPDGVQFHGETDRVFAVASVTKPISAWATLIAVEEGTVALDLPVAGPGDRGTVTLRHLLAHASGLPFDGTTPVAPPGTRRIYSNSGIERATDAVATAAAMPFATYLDEAVLRPLGMRATALRGSPAHGVFAPIGDLARFAAELFDPTLISRDTSAEATAVQFPGLAGIVPSVGRFDPCDWGLGVELKGNKHPHWMGTTNAPATFGHFGGSGTFLWVDVGARTAVSVLTDRRFTDWAADALTLWPAFSDAVLAEVGSGHDGDRG